MGCNCGDNEYEIIVDNNGSYEPTTPEYYITLENVGVDGFSPTINQVNTTSSSFQLQITDVNGTETTGDIPLLSYLDDNFVTNSSLASTLTAYVTSTSLATTLTDYVTNTSLATTLADYVTDSDLTTTLTSYVTNSSLSSTLTNYVTNSSLSSTLSAYALDANVVHKADTETITGRKIFTNIDGISSAWGIYTNTIMTDNNRPLFIDVRAASSDKTILLGNSNATTIKIGKSGTTSTLSLYGTTATLNDKNIATTDQIPTVNNNTITLTQGGVTKGSFTLNQSSDTTIELDAGGSSIPNPIEFSETYDDGEGRVTTATLQLGLTDSGYPYPIAKVQYNSTWTGGSASWSEYFINNTFAKVNGGLKNNYGSSTYSTINQLEVDVDGSTIAINGSGKVYAKEMVGADSITGGSSGLVPAPSAGDQEKYLRGDGTWHTVSGGGSSYTAGTGIEITNDTISIDTSVVAQLSDIPTVNNPTITFTQGGVSKGTITLNQSSNQTIALDAGGGGGAVIDDTQASSSTVYSSQKTQDLIDALTNRIAALEANINGGNA